MRYVFVFLFLYVLMKYLHKLWYAKRSSYHSAMNNLLQTRLLYPNDTFFNSLTRSLLVYKTEIFVIWITSMKDHLMLRIYYWWRQWFKLIYVTIISLILIKYGHYISFYLSYISYDEQLASSYCWRWNGQCRRNVCHTNRLL